MTICRPCEIHEIYQTQRDKLLLEQEHKLPKGILVNSKSKSKNSLMNQKIKSVEFQNEFVHPIYGKPTKLTPNGYLFTINIPNFFR